MVIRVVLYQLHEQSSDINQGVERPKRGARRRRSGYYVGYASNESLELMPATLILFHVILKELSDIREQVSDEVLRPDQRVRLH